MNIAFEDGQVGRLRALASLFDAAAAAGLKPDAVKAVPDDDRIALFVLEYNGPMSGSGLVSRAKPARASKTGTRYA